MDRHADRLMGTRAASGAGAISVRNPPLVGRRDALRAFDRALDATAAGTFEFLGLVGEPGAGKTRLLGELAAGAADRKLAMLWGRAAEFEQEIPFGVAIDAFDAHLEASGLPDGLTADAVRLLATVFPSLPALAPGDSPHLGDQATSADLTGLGRYRLYRAVRQLLGELTAPSGLVLVLDDVHWADDASIELLDHLLRHPPRGGVLVAVAYRPAQAAPRLTALVEGHGHQVPVGPLSSDEVERFLGPQVNRSRRQKLYEASGGNPFYLEALARMGEEPIVGGDGKSELPPAVQAALQLEMDGLSRTAVLVARAAAVAADEFEPALAAVAAEVSEDVALTALDELVSRDVVRPAAPGRFRFRHPLVRHATYGSAAAGWRLAAHARIADHLARLGAPATLRAHHVVRSGHFGDRAAITTLVEAARIVAPQAPATAAYWLQAALRLMPVDSANPDPRLELLLELARLQAVSGRLKEGLRTAHEALRLLPSGDHTRRARAVRFCALMERHLSRPHEARALLLDELRRVPDPQSAVAVPLRLRLVAESLIRSDYRAAQAVLDLMPANDDEWEPSLPLAIAAMRPLPALAALRVTDAIRYIEAAGRLEAAAPDEHVAEWLDAIAWLCWTEMLLGRYRSARQRFARAVAVARSTGQSYMVSNLLAGQARSHAMLGQLAEATIAAEEAAEGARLLGSGLQLVIALAEQCMVASWSGDEESALRLGEQAVRASENSGEWQGSLARYAQAVALIDAGRLDVGAEAMLEACNGFKRPKLDPTTQLFCCEMMAYVESARARPNEAAIWADRADMLAHPELEINLARARLARAHALRATQPATAAEHAGQAARLFDTQGLRIDAGRAGLRAGVYYTEAGERAKAREELRVAAQILEACGARSLHAQAIREQRRLGVRIPGVNRRGTGPYGLTRRELEVATLVGEGNTNQQIAEKLFLSIRTVEAHLSHIFTKLDVTSRVGVVNALQQRSL